MFVKICGITNEEDALLAIAMGADCLGFNFVHGSPRKISTTEAESIIKDFRMAQLLLEYLKMRIQI